MSTTKPSRTARKTAATRRSIVDAAERLLLAGGPEGVTLEAVAERADVAVQTVYNRVGGRSAVLLAVAERALERNREYMDAAYATPGTPQQRIELASAAYVRFATERSHEFRLLVNPPDEPEALKRIGELVEDQNAKLASALRDGIADGSVNPDLDTDQAAIVLWATMNGVLSLAWRTDRHHADPDKLGRLLLTVTTIIRDGLAARRASRKTGKAPRSGSAGSK